MPARATVFDTHALTVVDMGEGPRNDCKYNGLGNLLLLTGFGNLAGNMEFWTSDDETGGARALRMACQMKVPNTTQYAWCADGQHVLTATTTPRLRVGNGWRVWNWKGECIAQHMIRPGADVSDELYEVMWRPMAHAPPPFKVGYLSKAQRDTAGLNSKGELQGPQQQQSDATVSNSVHGATGAQFIATSPTQHPVDVLIEKGAVANGGGHEKTKGAYVPPHMRSGAKPKSLMASIGAATPKVKMSETEKKIINCQKVSRSLHCGSIVHLCRKSIKSRS